MKTIEQEREDWLATVRASLTRAHELAGDKGTVPVRARAAELNWLIEQLGSEKAARLDLVVAPG